MYLNEELYMLKLSQLSDEDLKAELTHCQVCYINHSSKHEPEIAALFKARLQTINKYQQMEKLLNV